MKRTALALIVLLCMLVCSPGVSALEEHIWSAWTIDKAPTCTEAGLRHRTCLADSGYPHTEEEILPALGHDYVLSEKLPTCTAPGQKIYNCSRCGESYTETFGEKTSHDYHAQVTKEASCKEEGILTYTCAVCGDSYTESIPQTKHEYIEEITASPDCGHAGLKTFTCSRCGERYTESFTEKSEHTFEQISEDTDGLHITALVCSVCGYRVELGKTPVQSIDPLTVVNMALGGTNMGLLLLFVLLLWPDLVVLIWYRRKKRRRAADRLAERGKFEGENDGK